MSEIENHVYTSSPLYLFIVMNEYNKNNHTLSDIHYTCLIQFGTILTCWLKFNAETWDVQQICWQPIVNKHLRSRDYWQVMLAQSDTVTATDVCHSWFTVSYVKKKKCKHQWVYDLKKCFKKTWLSTNTCLYVCMHTQDAVRISRGMKSTFVAVLLDALILFDLRCISHLSMWIQLLLSNSWMKSHLSLYFALPLHYMESAVIKLALLQWELQCLFFLSNKCIYCNLRCL